MVAPVRIDLLDPGTFWMALVAFTAGFQAEIVPSNEAKMKAAAIPGATSKSVLLPLKMIPVGLPIAVCGVCGIVTINDCFAPAPL